MKTLIVAFLCAFVSLSLAPLAPAQPIYAENQIPSRGVDIAYTVTIKNPTSHLYEVAMSPTGIDALHITVQRRDGSLVKDWRHLQQIKNELAGPEREAVELYPAESRKTDTSNKWHLWVLPIGVRFDFGFPQRDVSYKEIHDAPGLKQRPL